MEYRSNTTVSTERPKGYINFLRNHFAQKFPIDCQNNEVIISFDSGKCRMSSTENKMKFLCSADSEEKLELIEDILSSHFFAEIGNTQIIQKDYNPYFTSNTYFQAINEGSFCYHNIQDGLSLQYGTMTELKSLRLSNSLSAGLSINIIFEGEVSFTLGRQKHTFGGRQGPECSLLFLAQDEAFTRYFKKGMQLRKLNVFASLTWLKKRCRSNIQLAQLNHLLSNHAQVECFQPSPEMMSLLALLIKPKKEEGLENDLIIEATLIQLLAISIEKLLNSQPILTKEERLQQKSIEKKHRNLDSKISKFIAQEAPGNPISLKEIADRLNVSISTLQRRFKSLFGMTVIEYARIERLEKAKRALIFDDLSIGEVAYMSGYQHTSNFISAFTKHYTMSPSQYKRTYLKS